MQLDPEYLRQHYASLTDETLLAVDRADLAEIARTIFDLEAGRRQLVPPQDTRHGQPAIPEHPDSLDAETEGYEAEVAGEMHAGGEQPGWLEDAAEVYSYAAVHS